MEIIQYRTELNEKRHNILVEEHACTYQMENFTNPEKFVKLLNDVYRLNRLAEEYVYIVALSCKNEPLGVFEVFHGTAVSAQLNPREVFIRLLLVGATGFLLTHNHPSGDCTPSRADITMTEKIWKCGKLMGIPLLDHIIIGDGYLSFMNKGLLDES